MIEYVHNQYSSHGLGNATPFGSSQAEVARRYHASFPSYRPTPLHSLGSLADHLGLGALYVKDESFRFGLNAFKVLGGSYCVGHMLASMAGIPETELSYDLLTREDMREVARAVTVVTATDGNHGRGIAWSARELGVRAVVYMPKGSSPERLSNIRALGAQADITELNYDDTVRLATRKAKDNGWILLQDTSWEGYEEVPTQIMRGYTTMALEAVEQLGEVVPTHVLLQAGVGAMAGALCAFFADHYREARPTIVIVEPSGANCIYRSARAADGKLHAVSDLHTIMAGLCCGEPCTIAWDMLHRYADWFVSVPDWVAAKGMRMLGNPMLDDARIVSGESGAVTTGLVAELMTDDSLQELRASLGLDKTSHVLCISTEGDTDRTAYRRIVWDGAYPSPAQNLCGA